MAERARLPYAGDGGVLQGANSEAAEIALQKATALLESKFSPSSKAVSSSFFVLRPPCFLALLTLW